MGDTYDFIPNYTGPNISDGKIQLSVPFGTAVPKDKLDALSRLHDTAYARWEDRYHREVADSIFYDDAIKLGSRTADAAAFAVKYGNYIVNSADNLIPGIASGAISLGAAIAQAVATGGVFGVVYGAVKNLYNVAQHLDDTATRKEINEYFATDPHKELQLQNMEWNPDGTAAPRTEVWNPNVTTLNNSKNITRGPKPDDFFIVSKAVSYPLQNDPPVYNGYVPLDGGGVNEMQRKTENYDPYIDIESKPADKLKFKDGKDVPELPPGYNKKLYFVDSYDWSIRKHKKKKKKNRVYALF